MSLTIQNLPTPKMYLQSLTVRTIWIIERSVNRFFVYRELYTVGRVGGIDRSLEPYWGVGWVFLRVVGWIFSS